MTKRYRTEFIVNAGQYEHVALWVEGDTIGEFDQALAELPDSTVQSIALAHTAIKSQLKAAWEAGHATAVATVKEVLQAVEESTVEAPSKPSWSTPMDPKPKAWDQAETKKAAPKAPADW